MNQLIVAKTVLMNEKDEILVLHRGEWKEHPERSHQADFPGGQVDEGEFERDAAIREINEETGISISPYDLSIAYTGTVLHEKDEQSINRILYVAQLDHTPEIKLSWEHESFNWVQKEHLLETKKFSTFYSDALSYLIGNKLI